MALGGTEEDLALIEGVISESEVEASDTKTMNGKLMNDLHRTIKELGISEVREGDDNLIISNKDERSVFEEPEPASSLKKPGLISQASQQGLVNKHTSAGGGSHSHLVCSKIPIAHLLESTVLTVPRLSSLRYSGSWLDCPRLSSDHDLL